jgi:lipoyl(octanoyl) transferase
VPFGATAALQERLREQVCDGTRWPVLLLCEHESVVTLGRSANPQNLLLDETSLKSRGISLHKASRGGDVTFHGPGQLVAYPVFPVRKGVVAHVQSMATAVISVLAQYGVQGEFRREEPGVWVGNSKICAFGVHIRRRVAIHGLALNVSTDLSDFGVIVPCGLVGRSVTSISNVTGQHVSVQQILPSLIQSMSDAFDLTLTPASDNWGHTHDSRETVD